MLYLQSFTYNPFQENTYILYNDDNECWIIDPGMYSDEEMTHFLSIIQSNGYSPKAIINTHAHLDHIFGVNALIQKFNIPFYIHPKEQPVLDNATGSAMLFGLNFTSIPTPTGYIDEKQSLKLGSDDLEVRFTPGHSPGSVIFYYQPGNWAIGGDVLFNGSIGRTDLPGGNFDTLINSIQAQLYTLPENTVVYPGHGPSTTIANEKLYNPFVNAQL